MASEVQKGNAPEERKIQRLFRDGAVTRLIKRCNDFGAGGVSVAVGELADGLEIELDAVRKKYEGLDGTELAISESQERMAVVVAPENEAKFIAAAQAGKPGGLPRGGRDRKPPHGHALARTDDRRPLPRLPRHQRRSQARKHSRGSGKEAGGVRLRAVHAARYGGQPQERVPPRPCRALRLHRRRGDAPHALWRQDAAQPRAGDGGAPARSSPARRPRRAA